MESVQQTWTIREIFRYLTTLFCNKRQIELINFTKASTFLLMNLETSLIGNKTPITFEQCSSDFFCFDLHKKSVSGMDKCTNISYMLWSYYFRNPQHIKLWSYLSAIYFLTRVIIYLAFGSERKLHSCRENGTHLLFSMYPMLKCLEPG